MVGWWTAVTLARQKITRSAVDFLQNFRQIWEEVCARAAQSCERSSNSVPRWESEGNQKRCEESNRKLRKKIRALMC